MKKYDLSNVDMMRRKDRQINDDDWIVSYLDNTEFGTLATVYEDQPFLTMAIFVYDKETHSIYLHTSKHGRLFANIEQNKKVCFSVGEIGRLLPAKTARDFSNEYKSVVVFGNCEVMTDMKEARNKMYLMIEKYFRHLKPEKDYQAITKPEIEEIAVFKISIDSWTAKQKEADVDFPGAIMFDDMLQLHKNKQ